MNNLRFYQMIKPIVPRTLQIKVRRIIACRRRRHFADVWPILETAGRPPDGWKGWPDGKKFAFVLTHDVETQRGVDRCRMVMDVEERYGFRSAFYFVPEVRYKVPRDLREEMVRRGFEVGVHGLRHDFTLFRSREEFHRQAQAINRHAKEWGAVGFRSPYMIRNLDWIRDDLDIEYDTSTFDTDPFEPHPYGVGTIFPFFVDGKGGGRQGYVELPCTLPQDLTLFGLLGESAIDVWKRKLDWIVSSGGMSLFDTHPDYMQPQAATRCDEYPLQRYEEFLKYAREHYAGQYWHALPKEVACFCRRSPECVRHGIPRRISMVAYSFYDTDGRIMRYAETLAREGHMVDAISLGRPGQSGREVVRGVVVDRIQTRKRDEKGPLSYLFRMLCFFFKSYRALARMHSRHPFDVVHVHSVPDFEVFAAWSAKRRGARVILDIHDLVPEFYVSKFGVGKRSIAYRILTLLERKAARFADHVIIANHIWRNTLVGRSVPDRKCTVILNNVDPAVFYQRERTRKDDRFIMVYPGGLQWHQGVDIAVRAFARIADRVPNAEFHIYGDGSEWNLLERLIREFHMEKRIRLNHPVPFHQIPEIMANADLGVVPKRADTFGDEAYSTKIMEYMSQGVPVLAARTAIDQYYFGNGEVHFFASGDVEELAASILRAATDDPFRQDLVERGHAYAARHNWASKRHEYLDLVEALVPENATASE